MTSVMLVQVAGMAPQAVLDRMQSMAPIRPTESMVQQALSGGTGGTYLAPALYRPVVQAMASPCYSTTTLSMCHKCFHSPVSITSEDHQRAPYSFQGAAVPPRISKLQFRKQIF